MYKFIIATFVLLSMLIVKLLFLSKNITKIHHLKIVHLNRIKEVLIQKQKILEEKSTIIASYQSQQKSNMEKLGDEIFKLQKKIFESLMNK